MKDSYGLNGYGFEAEGKVCDLINDDPGSLFRGMIEKTKHDIGEKVYLISYDDGYMACHDLGWIVIYDVDDLLSKVLKEDSITITVGTDTTGHGIIGRFTELLDREGIRYDHKWTTID